MNENPKCPDFSSHFENAYDRLFPQWRSETLADDQYEVADAEGECEYQSCEGHS